MRALALVAAAATALVASAAEAQPYDPSFRWRTLETRHFRVHFHQGEEALAQDVAREAERAHARLAPRLGHAPARRTEIVLSDDSDDANGSATPLPYNTMRLLAAPPSSLSVLHDYRDWLRQLVEHEYTHVLHLDNVGGLPSVVNRVFGKLWIPNGLVPAFVVEGLAVANEAEDDPRAGRNASALFDMYARALALDGPFPALDDAANPFLDWPVGNTPYLLGGRFMAYLEARFGAERVAGFAADQGSQVWPYAPSWAARRWFGGQDLGALWAGYAAAERAHAEARRDEVRARPVTTPAPLTRRGGTVESPRFSPDGSFVAYHSRSLHDRPGLRRVTLDGTDLGRAATVDANGALALLGPREALVAIGEVRHEFRVHDDLYAVDLDGGERRRVTFGERATDPDVSRDGQTAVYVRRTGGGTMALVRRALAGGQPEVLFAHGGAEVFAPRIGPDGAVAFELHEGGQRDIALARGGAVERITDDDALDTGPAWTPDGRFLLFASDRSGIFNLYAWEVTTGALRQVTNVELGALQPDVSPDGRTIVFVGYSRAGYDLATIPFDEATWLEPIAAEPAATSEASSLSPRRSRGEADASATSEASSLSPRRSRGEAAASATPEASSLSPRRSRGEAAASATPEASSLSPQQRWGERVRVRGADELTPTSTSTSTSTSTAISTSTSQATAGPLPLEPTGPPPDLPSRPYSPWSTLRPTFWLPILAADGAGTTIGAFTGGADVLLRHVYTAQGWWSVDGDEPGYAVFYQGGWSWPRLDLSSSLFLDDSPGPPDRLQRVWTYADAGLTFTFTRLARALALRASWSGTAYDSVGAPGPLPERLEPFRFEDGFLSQLSLQATYSDARRYVRSISPEEGRTLSFRLRFAGPEIGSDYAISRAQAAWAEYLRVPFTRSVVLATRLAGGVADGSIGLDAPFELGGVSSTSPLSLVPGFSSEPSDQLRGYDGGALAGTAFVLANVELRFPLAAPRLGRGTWPLFLRRVHGAVFLDAGDAFDLPGELPFAGHRLEADELRFSAGAELRLEVVLGYHIRADVRAGVARPMGALLGEGRDADRARGIDAAEVSAYVTVGAAF